MSRNDLPSEKASNFSARLRETIQTMLGTRGDKLDRVITLRDLIESGITKLPDGWRPGGSGAVPLLPGSSLPDPDVYVPDLTPPPTPTGFAVDAAISNIFIEHDEPLYPQGHGHLRTRVYGATVQAGDPLPTFSDAVEISQFSGTVHAHPTNPATTWRLWIKWETNDLVLSASPAGGTNGIAVTTGQDVTKMVQAMSGPGNPFTILTAPVTIDGFTYPEGTYSVRSFIIDAQITNAKIANLAVDDAKVASLSVSKLVAGSIAVGQHIQSTGYVANTSGWRINGDGTAEFSGVVVRGTVYANDGQIGGITIASDAVRAGQTAYNTGSGFHLGSDGRLSLGNSAGNNLTWDGTNLNVVGSGTFSGALSAATGTFAGRVSGGEFTTGAYTGYAWPPAGAGNIGTYLGPSGLLIGNANNGKYLQVTQDGNIYTPGFDVVNGTMTVKQANVINTLNIAGNAVSVSNSVSGTGTSISTSITIPPNVTARVSAAGYRAVAGTTNLNSVTQTLALTGASNVSEDVHVATGSEGEVMYYFLPSTSMLNAAVITTDGDAVTVTATLSFGFNGLKVLTLAGAWK